MVSRRDLKEAHEKYVLACFTEYLKQDGKILTIIEQPDPPEAIVEINGTKTWIEITDAFLDQAHARSLTTRAADDVCHIRDDKRLVIEPDVTFQAQLHGVISKKYDKTTMQRISAELGPGILLVGIFTPFNTAKLIVKEEKLNIAKLITKKSIPIFDKIYVYDGNNVRKFHVLF